MSIKCYRLAKDEELPDEFCVVRDIGGEPSEYTFYALESEVAKLRELVLALADCRNTTCDDCVRWDYPEGGCSLDGVMRDLGIEVEE